MDALESGNISEEWKRQLQRYVRGGHGLSERRFSAKRTVLLVIDMQRFFIDPRSHASFPAAEEIIKSIQQLLRGFRSLNLPVIFTRHALLNDEPTGMMGSWWGDVLREGDPFSAIDDRLESWPGERIIRKTRYSAFVGTNLDELLKELDVNRLIITGVMTHLCCESTARDAFMRNHEVIFVIDATATDDEDLHIGSLRAMADGFAILATTREVLDWMSGQR